MPRYFLVAMSLVALSTPAIADPGDAFKVEGPSVQGASSPGVPAPSTPPAAVLSTRALAPADLKSVPALAHIAASGAELIERGAAHGLRSVAARLANQFIVLEIAPDGLAVVGGPELDLGVDELMTLGAGQVTELGEMHGLRGLYLRNGSEFQVLYATPDGKATIAGVMWDATGKNLTREQVAKIPGAIPTVVVEKDGSKAVEAAARADTLLEVERTTFGLYGDPSAARLWLIFDPYCSFSMQALDALRPYVTAGRVELALVPVSILDYETQGRSTPAAESLLSQDRARMAEAWARRSVEVQPTPEAPRLLEANNRIAEAIGLKGTPTLIWRKADGTAGEIDGVPKSWEALIAEVEGARDVSGR